MTPRVLLFAALGLASGFVLARILPNIWWVNGVTFVVLGALYLYIRWRRRQS